MVGIDIVKNERIEKALEKFGDKFLNRIYAPEEVEYCKGFKEFIPCLAARWACKEAVLKAVYMEFGVLLKFKEISVRGRKGQPAKVKILREGIDELLSGRSVVVSISHEKDFSVAVAFIR